MIAAIRAANTTATPSASCLTTFATVLATAVPTTKNALKLNAAENQGAQRAGRACRDDGSHRVGGVVEAIGEVEDQRQHDHTDDADQQPVHGVRFSR